MSDSESTEAASPPTEAAPPAAKPAPPPPRELPSEADIAAWIEGADVPTVGALFEKINTKRYDTLVTLLYKQELLPQHWQVISRLEVPDGADFDRLPEVGRLRQGYRDMEISRRRLASLRVAWEELRGKKPSLWTAGDLFAAIRRIIDKDREVEFYDLLTAVRDIWRGLTLPHGRHQLELLWGCLNLIRSKTKK